MGTFVQIHTLTGYSGVLLNRDDSGMAKRIVYGNTERIRISSQFIKRKLRLAEGPHSLANVGTMGVRSRLIFRKKIAEPLVEAGYPQEQVIEATMAVMAEMFGDKKAKTKKDEDAAEKEEVADPMSLLERKELIIMGEKEIAYIIDRISETLDEVGASAKPAHARKAMEKTLKEKLFKENLRKMSNVSLDVAAFGRMSTGDALSTVDAAVHVAHAFTVSPMHSEIDYFTAVDELKDRSLGDDGGAAHVGETELNSPLLYGYYVVDIDQLVSNLAGLDNAPAVAAKMTANLIQLVASQIVGAKKGGTAPYSSADFVLVEVGSQMPRTLAEAFRTATKPELEDAVRELVSYLEGKEAMYGRQANHRFVSTIAASARDEQMPLPVICDRLVEILGEA